MQSSPGQVVIYAGELAGALVAIGAVARFVVVNPLKKWLREQIKAPVDAVHDQVTPNHGTSLADAVDRIEAALDEHILHHPGRRRRRH